MAETALGLFEDINTANSVVEALRGNGIPASGIRIVSSQATGLPVDSATSTPGTDLAVALGRDLRSMGASNYESEAYVKGIQNGNALVFATGTTEQARAAIEVMNDHFALDIEEFSGSVPELTPVVAGAVGGPNTTERIEKSRNRTEGAKVFSW